MLRLKIYKYLEEQIVNEIFSIDRMNLLVFLHLKVLNLENVVLMDSMILEQYKSDYLLIFPLFPRGEVIE